jgi:hypothetical protein
MMSERDELIGTIRGYLTKRRPDQMTTAWGEYQDALSALDRLAAQKPEPSSGEPTGNIAPWDNHCDRLKDAEARAEKAEGEAKALREALAWISQVNAMDYEYQAHARAALATKKAKA